MSLTKWDEAPTRVPGPLMLSSSSDVPNGSLYIGSDGDMIFKNTLGQPLIHGYKLMIYQPRNATDVAGPGTFTSTTETAFISTSTTTNIRNGLGMNIKAGMLRKHGTIYWRALLGINPGAGNSTSFYQVRPYKMAAGARGMAGMGFSRFLFNHAGLALTENLCAEAWGWFNAVGNLNDPTNIIVRSHNRSFITASQSVTGAAGFMSENEGSVRWDDTVDNAVNFTHYFVGTAGQAWVDAFEMYI